MINYQVEEFLLKVIDRIEFKDDALFFAVDGETSYKSLLREYIFASCENRLLHEKNKRLLELLEQWLAEQGKSPKKQSHILKKLQSIEDNIELKEKMKLAQTA
jgi:hypothetical protein